MYTYIYIYTYTHRYIIRLPAAEGRTVALPPRVSTEGCACRRLLASLPSTAQNTKTTTTTTTTTTSVPSLICPGSTTTSEVVVRRALGLHVQ